MTSKPASRNARAMTLAPRSWPSRPGLAMRTLRGGVSLIVLGTLQQLHEHAERGRRLQERHLAVGAGARFRVDELHALVAQIAQVGANVGRAETQMVQTRAAALDEARHRRIRISWLEQLDQHVRRAYEYHFQLTFGHIDAVDDAQTQLVPVKVHRVVDAWHGDADVVNRQRRLLHLRQVSQVSAPASTSTADDTSGTSRRNCKSVSIVCSSSIMV